MLVYFYTEDHLSFPFSLNYVLWHNILGKLTKEFCNFWKAEKGN